MSKRIAIVGSREHPDLSIVRAYVRSLPEGTVVISGGADGVDKEAVEEAVREGLGYATYEPRRLRPPDTAKDGRTAQAVSDANPKRDPLIGRNADIVRACHYLVAFPDGSKGGTIRTLELCKIFRRPHEVRTIKFGHVQIERFDAKGRRVDVTAYQLEPRYDGKDRQLDLRSHGRDIRK